MRDGARNLRGEGSADSPDSPHSPTVDGERARLDGSKPAILAEAPLSPRAPLSPWPAGSVVRLDVSGGRLRVDAPAGWRDIAAMRRDLDALKPELLRALAPELPPVDAWPLTWRELFEERACIAAEGGAPDPLAVAEADLRLAVWRGDVEALPVEAARAAG